MRTRSDSPTKSCTVDGCGKPLRARGYCGSHYNQILNPDRHPKVTRTCEQCGVEYDTVRTNGRFHSLECRDAARWGGTKAERVEAREMARLAHAQDRVPVDRRAISLAASLHLRSPLRVALEDGDSEGVLDAIRACVLVDENGCWVWQRKMRDGYPVLLIAGKMRQIHRLALEASLGAPLGAQPAHHICANTGCCNPSHLQPVTHRENVAEMLSRNYMVQRIAALEAALALTTPSHPLLSEVGLPVVA